VRTLRRRHLEAYTYDDEVLIALCEAQRMPRESTGLLADKASAIAASQSRGNPQDDVKSAAGEIYNIAKRRLRLTAVGNDQMAFARATLAPLIKPGMRVYAELEEDVFGM